MTTAAATGPRNTNSLAADSVTNHEAWRLHPTPALRSVRIVVHAQGMEDARKMAPIDPTTKQRYRELVNRIRSAATPSGEEFAACRAVLEHAAEHEMVTQALTSLLEGALADPTLSIDDTQDLVPLLKALAHGALRAEDLL